MLIAVFLFYFYYYFFIYLLLLLLFCRAIWGREAPPLHHRRASAESGHRAAQQTVEAPAHRGGRGPQPPLHQWDPPR